MSAAARAAAIAAGSLAVSLLVSLCLSSRAAAQGNSAQPRLPARSVDLGDARAPSGRTIAIGPDADLQGALDAAAPGDTLSLDPRGVYGPIVLPNKAGEGFITLRSAAPLAPPGTRVTPADAAHMPKLLAIRGPAITAAPGAHGYRFAGLEIRPRAGEFATALVVLGDDAMSTAELPHAIVFAGCYLHGDPALGSRRGIALNAGSTAILDSWFADFKEVGADSQAIAGWSGTGPFLLRNNHLEAAGENLLFGGADPPGPDRIPSDIEIRDNQLEKPLAWKAGSPGYAKTRWSVKNLLELKDARRVLIEGNVFARTWAQAQSGFAILFTVRNQDDTAPFSVVEDVTFSGNLVQDAGAGVNILGRDDSHGDRSAQTRRIAIEGNRFEDLGGDWGGTGALFQILEGPADITIEHNTALQSGSVIVADGAPSLGLVFQDNVVAHNAYGIVGTGTAPGASTIAAWFPGAVIEGNVFIGGDAARYPRGNVFVASPDAVFAGPDRRAVRAPYAGKGASGFAPRASTP